MKKVYGLKHVFIGVTAQPGGYFGEGVNKPVHLISIQCSGSEIELTECESEEEGSTDHNGGGQDGVGVRCQPGKSLSRLKSVYD